MFKHATPFRTTFFSHGTCSFCTHPLRRCFTIVLCHVCQGTEFRQPKQTSRCHDLVIFECLCFQMSPAVTDYNPFYYLRTSLKPCALVILNQITQRDW